MIDANKFLTIRQAKNEIKKLENNLDLYLTKKKINFEKTQPAGNEIKSVVTSKGNVLFDKFTHYVIKDEELDSTIYSIQESILAYQQFIVKEMKRISDAKGSELITYLRDEENLSWNEIKDIVHYSLRQCHRLYNCKKN